MDTITTTIEREWLDQIIARTKKIEYREIKPYWEDRFQRAKAPFRLRLRNGMTPPVPEATVLITKVVRNTRNGTFDLYIGKILEVKNWREPKAPTAAQKAALIRKRRAAGRKAALTRKRRAAGKKAAATKRRRVAARKAVATRRARASS